MVESGKRKLAACAFFTLLFLSSVDARADCGKIPYSVEVKELGGEIRLSLTEKARSAFTAGGSAINAAYNAMLSQAIGEVLEFYGCQIKEQIAASTLPEDEKSAQAQEVDLAVSDFGIKLSTYQESYEKLNPEALLALGDHILELKRPPGKGIDIAFFDKAIGEAVIPIKRTFLQKSTVRGWLDVQIPAGRLDACGGVVLASVDSNIDSIQRAVADIRVPFRQYLDRKQAAGVANANAKLFSLAKLRPIPPSTVAEASAFQGCAQAAAVSSAAPNPGREAEPKGAAAGASGGDK